MLFSTYGALNLQTEAFEAGFFTAVQCSLFLMKEAYVACFLQNDIEIAIRSSWSSFFLHECTELAERTTLTFLTKAH